MLMNEIAVKQDDGYTTILYPYYTTAQPKGSILVLHGMAEHHSRFIEFSTYLNRCGFDVFLYDHRGHGTDKKLEELGVIAEHNGYIKITRDAIHLLHFIKKSGRSERIILFAHSMGSLVARNVIQHDDTADSVILSGTNHSSPLLVRVGLVVASVIQAVKGPRYISPFMNNLMFNNKLYTGICERTKYDWLTRNHYIVGQYIHDPYCGFICSVSMYRDILKLVKNAISPYCVRNTRTDLPIFIISGEMDPVGGYGKDIYRFVSLLQKLGFSAVECTLYADCRHELLNELNNKEVMHDIVKWLNHVPLETGNNDLPQQEDE